MDYLGLGGWEKWWNGGVRGVGGLGVGLIEFHLPQSTLHEVLQNFIHNTGLSLSLSI